jgi:DNA-binding transcriptional regulator YdaS (Cro superfamily)
MTNLQCAYQVLGSQSALAKAIGVVPQVVNNWHRRGNVPAEYCPLIERATNGQVRCEDLRPDVDWSVLRCSCGDKAAA